MVERLAVNEDVQGSSPCREVFFFLPIPVIINFRLKAMAYKRYWLTALPVQVTTPVGKISQSFAISHLFIYF